MHGRSRNPRRGRRFLVAGGLVGRGGYRDRHSTDREEHDYSEAPTCELSAVLSHGAIGSAYRHFEDLRYQCFELLPFADCPSETFGHLPVKNERQRELDLVAAQTELPGAPSQPEFLRRVQDADLFGVT